MDLRLDVGVITMIDTTDKRSVAVITGLEKVYFMPCHYFVRFLFRLWFA
jgi:hypothetical protein